MRWLHNQDSQSFVCSIIREEDFVLTSCIWKASATELWNLLAELLDILESPDRVRSSKPKLEREGPMRFQGRAGLCSEGFSYWTIVLSNSVPDGWLLPVLDIAHSFYQPHHWFLHDKKKYKSIIFCCFSCVHFLIESSRLQ